MLINYMPNCIEEIFFGSLIYKMMVMDEVRLVFCFGLKKTEEGFINTYTCHPPACTGDAGLSERNKNKSDVFVYMPFPGWMLFPTFYGFFFQQLLLEYSFIRFSLWSSGITLATQKWTNAFPLAVKMSVLMNFPFGIPMDCWTRINAGRIFKNLMVLLLAEFSLPMHLFFV